MLSGCIFILLILLFLILCGLGKKLNEIHDTLKEIKAQNKLYNQEKN